MPIYDFICPKCGQEDKDVWLSKSKDRKKQVCGCCGVKMEVAVNDSSSFHLKGTGWYVTDYKNKSSSKKKKTSRKSKK